MKLLFSDTGWKAAQKYGLQEKQTKPFQTKPALNLEKLYKT